jgi:hypothetical protein
MAGSCTDKSREKKQSQKEKKKRKKVGLSSTLLLPYPHDIIVFIWDSADV